MPIEDKYETRNEINGKANMGYNSDDDDTKFKIKKTYATFDSDNQNRKF